jgi:hypothetical protein
MKFVTAILLVVALSACGSGGTTGGGMSMTDAAKQFLESTFKGDKEAWRAVACDPIKGQADTLDSMPRPEGFTMDFSALKYEVKEESGDSGKVAISGAVKMTVAGTSTEQSISDMGLSELNMKREGGSWKACPQL